MNRKFLPILLIFLAACSKPVPPPTKPPILVVARQYEFSPSVIRLTVGEEAWIEVSSVDVQHSFEVPGLDIEESVQPGRPALIYLKPQTPGTYPVRCGIRCGRGHDQMTGTIIVEQAGSSAPK